jgi:hypothetical protein
MTAAEMVEVRCLDSKREATAAARLALLGFELHVIGSGRCGYAVRRWDGFGAYCPRLEEVEQLTAVLATSSEPSV